MRNNIISIKWSKVVSENIGWFKRRCLLLLLLLFLSLVRGLCVVYVLYCDLGRLHKHRRLIGRAASWLGKELHHQYQSL